MPAWLPQTAAAAEHLGLFYANKYSRPGVEAVVDCMSALRSHTGGSAYATGPQRPFGGLWLDWGPAWNVDKVHKVKAHDSITDRHKEGNSVVDELAKGTAWEHLGPMLPAENYKKK